MSKTNLFKSLVSIVAYDGAGSGPVHPTAPANFLAGSNSGSLIKFGEGTLTKKSARTYDYLTDENEVLDRKLKEIQADEVNIDGVLDAASANLMTVCLAPKTVLTDCVHPLISIKVYGFCTSSAVQYDGILCDKVNNDAGSGKFTLSGKIVLTGP